MCFVLYLSFLLLCTSFTVVPVCVNIINNINSGTTGEVSIRPWACIFSIGSTVLYSRKIFSTSCSPQSVIKNATNAEG